ncbi:unnamed protein product [Rotaria sp. Silwood2]|nr:unnamed protein product [Rotaria sp. Silwood2]CAF4090898.1 unnamed protein product [Rotaria sp. Silwood2]
MHGNSKPPNNSLDRGELATPCSTIQQTGMTASDWNKRWENKANVRRWELTIIHPFLEKYLPSSTTHQRVIVPLAGKTADLFWLVDKGFQVIGIDCSSLAFQELLDEQIGTGNYTFEQRSPNCSIYSACDNRLVLVACDIFADELAPSLIGGPASFVWDRAALAALHPADHARYIEKLKQLSKTNALFLFSVYWHSGPTDRDPPFPISTETMNKLFSSGEVVKLDELDSMNEDWAQVGFKDLCERCYRVQL